MRLDDWRVVPAEELAPWYAAERARWLSTLCWDTSTTWQNVEAARRAGSLPGFVVRDENAVLRGWSFHLKHRGELQIGNVVTTSATATEKLLSGIFHSPEARSAGRWMAFGWFNAPGVVNALRARDMGVERYRYLHRSVTNEPSSPHSIADLGERFGGQAHPNGQSHPTRPAHPHDLPHPAHPPQLRGWQSADNVLLASLLASAYHAPDSSRPFAANGTMNEWIEYSSHLLHGSGCGAFDAAISRVAPGTDGLDGAAVITRLMPTTAHLAQLVVQPAAQGRGLGERLLVSAVDAASRSGCECVTLLVREANAAASRLYSRLGFIERAQFVSASSAIGCQLSAVS